MLTGVVARTAIFADINEYGDGLFTDLTAMLVTFPAAVTATTLRVACDSVGSDIVILGGYT